MSAYTRTLESFGPTSTPTETRATFTAAFAHLKAEGGTLELKPRTTYTIDGRLVLSAANGFKIHGNYAKIRMSPDVPIANSTQVLHLVKCADFALNDLVTDGNAHARLPAPGSPADTTSHGLSLAGCRNGVIHDVRSIFSPCDGFYLGAISNTDIDTYCRHLELVRCYAGGCHRNGVSVVDAHHIAILGGEFAHQDQRSPGAGIDIEGNHGNAEPACLHITLDRVHCHGNRIGLQVSPKAGSHAIQLNSPYIHDNLEVDILAAGQLQVIGGTIAGGTPGPATQTPADARSRLVSVATRFAKRSHSALASGKRSGSHRVLAASFEACARGTSSSESRVVEIEHSVDFDD